MITPWNFPWPSLVENPAAVVCGNTCVIKPRRTRRSHLQLVQALTDAGIPKGVINMSPASAPKSERRSPSIRRPRHLAHRLFGGRQNRRRDGRQELQTLLARTRRQESMIVLDDANLDLAIEGGLWAPSAPPDNAAPRPAASSCRKASTASSSTSSSPAPGKSKSATASTRRWKWTGR